jgi:5-methylthioadenosine/S-adenosylhomocysteine deaminase
MTRSVVIRGGLVLGRHGAEAADILVAGDSIVAVGPPGMVVGEPSEVLDATGRLLSPGLINAHTHSGGNLARSIHDRWTLELLLNGSVANVGGQTIEEKYLSAVIGALEMISKGCTACYDLFFEFPAPTVDGIKAVARAYADTGLRSVIAPMVADRSFYQAIPGLATALPEPYRSQVITAQATPGEVHLEVVEKALAAWTFDRDQVTLALAPAIPMYCSDTFLQRVAAFARDHRIGLHTHLAESKVQAVYANRLYGCSPTAHLRRLGVLGPNFTAAHCVWVDDDDVAMLADSGSSVAHNPGSNMRLGAGIAATRRMRDRGLTVGIGTDSRVCSDNLNMFEAMRLAAFVSRVQGPDHERWLIAGEAFEMATEGSARALGFEGRLGRLAPGFKADIVFLDLANLNYIPLNNALHQAVFAEDGTAVESVMIGGRMVYAAGRFPGFDLATLRAQAQQAITRIRAANADARAFAARLEPVVACFCGALGRHAHPVRRYSGGEDG